MIQTRLNPLKVKYTSGPYNKYNDVEQWIRLSDGCPNNCPYCYAPTKLQTYPIPDIIRHDVKIMDMNLLANPHSINILKSLPRTLNKKKIEYNLICGVDYRHLTEKKLKLLRTMNIPRLRLAWDWYLTDQLKIKNTLILLKKHGFTKRKVMIFILCNWKIPYQECIKKLDLLKIWGVMVSDCYFDNQKPPNLIPLYWNDKELKEFRAKCRAHNQLIIHDCYPELIHFTR